MEGTALALNDENRNEPAALAAAREVQMIPASATILDRANLQFFADMIEHAGLIPNEKENGNVMPIAKRKFRVMAKIVGGVAHGFDPISAQENLDIIEGKIKLNARGTSVKIARTGRYATRVEYLTDEGCKLAVLEKNAAGTWVVNGFVEFTKEHAKAAGLLGKPGDMYKKYGPDMYFARCITRVAKRFVPEALDTDPVKYDVAKQPVSQVTEKPEPVAEPQQIAAAEETPVETNVPQVGDEYQDAEYTPAEETIDAEFVPADVSESNERPADTDEAAEASAIEAEEPTLDELYASAKDKINNLTGGKAEAVTALMNGRILKNFDMKQMKAFHIELDKKIALEPPF